MQQLIMQQQDISANSHSLKLKDSVMLNQLVIL